MKRLLFDSENIFIQMNELISNFNPTKLEEDPNLNQHSVKAIQARYRKMMKEKEKQKKKQASVKRIEIQRFKGMISSIFETVMDLYVAKEDE